MPTTSRLKYPRDPVTCEHVRNHAMPSFFEEAFVARIKADYGVLPVEVERRTGLPLRLDAGGMILLDAPWHKVHFRHRRPGQPRRHGYFVEFKEEQALLYAGALLQRLDSPKNMRARALAGVQTMTLYQHYWHVVLPVADVRRIVKEMQRVGPDGYAQALARQAALAASSTYVHIPGALSPSGLAS